VQAPCSQGVCSVQLAAQHPQRQHAWGH
jgi:hypothetical protein